MCNAWNHSSGCNCGWGGINYGTYGYGNLRASSLQDIINRSSVSQLVKDEQAKTSCTSCPWCQTGVYYHTNGFGDSVYFDSLGYPWPIHECFQRYLETKKALNKKYSYNPLTNFFNLSENEQKLLVLIGAVRQIPNIIFGELLIYKITEQALAKQMGISIQQLINIYGSLYFRQNDGIKIISDIELKQFIKINKNQNQTLLYLKPKIEKPKLKPKAIVIPNSVILVEKPKLKHKRTVSSNSVIPVESIKSDRLSLCPYCKQAVRNNKLQKHIKNKCMAKKTQ